ncbi:MAG: hypothetical protein ABRQ23_00090 [Syntrophomonadaceae bacterium]
MDSEQPLSSKSHMDLNIYHQQEEELKKYLTKGNTGSEKFIVLNYETGFGKSRITDRAIVANIFRKYLLVKRYNSEKDESLKTMKEVLEIEWEESPFKGCDAVSEEERIVVINTDNSYEYEKSPEGRIRLIEAQIVIISHEKYRLLSDSHLLRLYTSGRDTLIIDENIEVPIFSISSQYFDDYKILFNYDLGGSEFHSIHEKFRELMTILRCSKEAEDANNEGNMSLIEMKNYERQFGINDELRKLEGIFKNHYHKIIESTRNSTIRGIPITALDYYRFFTEIKSVMENQCIYSFFYNALFTFRKFNFWTLENNIILDASGDILTQYKLNPKFEVIKKTPIFDYSETSIHHKNAKSNKSEIDENFSSITGINGEKLKSVGSYLYSIAQYIAGHHDDKRDKTLVITHKDHNKTFERLMTSIKPSENIYTAWHGNILGKNDWRDCNKLFISSIYNLPEPAYILMYSFYSGKKIKSSYLKVKIENNQRVFKTRAIEELKRSFIVHNIYQEMKRINRNVDRAADIYLITDIKYLKGKIKSLMKNVGFIEDYDIKLPPKRNSFETRDIYQTIENELIRMSQADKSDKYQFSKELFCQNTRIESNRLKEKLEVGYIKELCDKYNLDYKKTFNKGSRYLYFLKKKQRNKVL